MKEIKVGEYVRFKCGLIYKATEYWLEEHYKKEGHTYDIVKHSSNIIDLIEVGDYVNGCLVLQKYEPNDLWEPIEIRVDSKTIKYFIDGEIKSIVTKEQFENIEYRLED